jgi:hypothetical protein
MPGFLVPKGSRPGTRAALPKARLVILVEAGTHLIFDALICPYKMGEKVRALKLLRSVIPGMLLMWDSWGGDKEVYEIDCIRVAARIPCW